LHNTKTEIEYLNKLTEGILISTDTNSYAEYMAKRRNLSKTESDIINLKTEINTINSRLDYITTLLEKIIKG
jgi:hypothetical protein